MKKVISFILMFSLFVLFVVSFAAEKSNNYVGVKKCQMCHKTKKSGNQFGIWQSKKHAQAYATLATPEAKEAAKKAGVAGDPQKAKECLVCHVTAFEAPAANKEASLTVEEGVSCEACHGPGSEYKSMKVMKAITAGTTKGADVGLIEPTKEVCVKCHNPKSPTYKEFVYEEAIKAIAHPIPK